MKSVILSGFFFLSNLNVFSQYAVEPIIPSAIIVAYDKQNKNLISIRVNPANATAHKRKSFLFYAENRFQVKELPFILAAIYLPVRRWGVTVDYSRAGNIHLSQSAVNVSLSRSVHPLIDIGLTLSAASLSTMESEWHPSFGYKIGLRFHCNNQLQTGIAFKQLKYSTNIYNELPLVEISAGVGYVFSEITTGAIQISSSLSGDMELVGGLSLKVKDKISINAGYSSGNYSLFGGMSFQHKFFRLGCYLSGHPYLGISPGLMLMSP
jgi:hypothetical protein